MRIYYDRHGRTRGYSLPLWAVLVQWIVIATLICTPIWLILHWLGIS